VTKKLVVCFDGTWNNADSENAETNVSLMSRAVRATPENDPRQQIVLYLRGVGSAGLSVQRVLEGATGLGLDDTIRSAYMFLAQNYLPGDLIYLFGFSRGAFSARSLAGLIGACGILKRQRLGDLGKAWHYYKRTAIRSPEDFVARTGTDTHFGVEIQFVGVWDTVGALGIPTSLFDGINNNEYGFHDTTPSKITKNAFHAIAIDEFRDEFVPTLWTGAKPDGCTISQVWFAGAHSDVGGGYVDRALADIPLVWMARNAERCGLELDWSMLPAGTDARAPRHDSRSLLSVAVIDLITPTLRAVCETEFPVSLMETLYRPNKNGTPLPTINESIHQSVIDRFAAKASLSTNDEKRRSKLERYAPRNIAPFFPGGQLAPGTRIDNT
jgi:uncharacterized protein (DUF2235 family)